MRDAGVRGGDHEQARREIVVGGVEEGVREGDHGQPRREIVVGGAREGVQYGEAAAAGRSAGWACDSCNCPEGGRLFSSSGAGCW